MSVREWPTALTGMLLIVVLIGLKSSSGTLLSRPGPPGGGFFGGGMGGADPLSTDGFHSGGVAGPGSPIVFPGPNDRRSAYFGLLKLPYIICYYAAAGTWPAFPPKLYSAVLDLGRHVFAMDDYGLRNYCSKYFRVTVPHRPCCASPGYPIPIPLSPNVSFTTSTTTTTEAPTTCVCTCAIRPGSTGFDEVPGKDKPTSKRPQKKPTPTSEEIDTEVITETDAEDGGDEQYPEEAEPEEEPEEDSGRLQLPMVDGRVGSRPKNGKRCPGAAQGCPSDTVPFVPLRNDKSSLEVPDLNRKRAAKIQLRTTERAMVAVPK